MYCFRLIAIYLAFLTVSATHAAELRDFKNKCIGAKAMTTPNSLLAVPIDCKGAPRWPVVVSALGEVRNGKWCMGISEASTDASHFINWSGCIGTVNLLWQFEKTGDTWIIRSMMNSHCLTRGARYNVVPCDGRPGQGWVLQK
jgi:hypothetical protein